MIATRKRRNHERVTIPPGKTAGKNRCVSAEMNLSASVDRRDSVVKLQHPAENLSRLQAETIICGRR